MLVFQSQQASSISLAEHIRLDIAFSCLDESQTLQLDFFKHGQTETKQIGIGRVENRDR